MVKELLTEKLRIKDPWHLLTIITVVLGYFGLLQKTEILTFQICDVHINEKTREIEVFYNHGSKTRPIGFKFDVPDWLYPAFKTYISQITNRDTKSWFLKTR